MAGFIFLHFFFTLSIIACFSTTLLNLEVLYFYLQRLYWILSESDLVQHTPGTAVLHTRCVYEKCRVEFSMK